MASLFAEAGEEEERSEMLLVRWLAFGREGNGEEESFASLFMYFSVLFLGF